MTLINNYFKLIKSEKCFINNLLNMTPFDRSQDWLRKRVKILQKKPQPEQRSEAWFKQRQTRITASEAASCLFRSKETCEKYVNLFGIKNFKYKDTCGINPYESRDEYIIKKCRSFFGESVFKDNPFTIWGKKYETL